MVCKNTLFYQRGRILYRYLDNQRLQVLQMAENVLAHRVLRCYILRIFAGRLFL